MRPSRPVLRPASPHRPGGRLALAAAALVLATLAACGGSSDSGAILTAAGPTEPVVAAAKGTADQSPQAKVGREIFFDGGLSSSGTLSCAGCHGPSRGFIALADIPLGGPGMDQQGLRQAPTLAYLAWTPAFGRDLRGDAFGGLMRDGRSASFAEQATHPLLASFEMDNGDAAGLLVRVKGRPWAARLAEAYGPASLTDPAAALAAVTAAVQAYQLEVPDFRTFGSKYDFVLRGLTALTDREANGLKVFNDPARGNCAACHTSTGNDQRGPLFTDHRFYALGVPRNWSIRANVDGAPLPAWLSANGAPLGAPGHAFYDLGLCGPLRTDRLVDATDCGKFRVPTLRNAALKSAYFHNGLKWSLQQVIAFKAGRDVTPGDWYRAPDGVTPEPAYNDLPDAFKGNVAQGAPFAGRNGRPSLTEGEINDVTLFLCTLIDGYSLLGTPTAQLRPGPQCQAALAGPGGL